MRQFKKILVGVDVVADGQRISGTLSGPTMAAVGRGIELAAANDAKLCFTAVLDPDDTTERLIHDTPSANQNVFDEAYAALSPVVESAKQRGIDVESRVLIGKSWLKLIREVLKEHYDLVVVGTRDKGPLDRILYGSTAIKLLRKAPCPVWVAKPSDDHSLSSVLVAHDLGPVGRYALDLGVSLARIWDLQLHVVHGVEFLPVGDPSGLGMVDPAAGTLHREARERILVELGGTEFGRSPQIRIVSGGPVPAILELVNNQSVDLVVMGTIGRSGIRGMLTGNTAERLLPRLHCSLLAVKPDGFQCPVDPE